MNHNSVLMLYNIPGNIKEEDLSELFSVAGPVNYVHIAKSGRTAFIVFEFRDAIRTAKEIFRDVKLYGRPLRMFDKGDIDDIHTIQEEEGNIKRRHENDFDYGNKRYRGNNFNDNVQDQCNTYQERNMYQRQFINSPVHGTQNNSFSHCRKNSGSSFTHIHSSYDRSATSFNPYPEFLSIGHQNQSDEYDRRNNRDSVYGSQDWNKFSNYNRRFETNRSNYHKANKSYNNRRKNH